MTDQPATAAQPLAIYVDGQGDPWMGNEDGTLSAMEAVADDDRYANWPVETVEGLFKGLTKVWSP